MNKKTLLIALIPAVIAISCNSAPESTETPAMDTTQD
jgi:hypothetical protein